MKEAKKDYQNPAIWIDDSKLDQRQIAAAVG